MSSPGLPGPNPDCERRVRIGFPAPRPAPARGRSEPLKILFFLQTAGGVALILFGVRFLRKGLDRLLGDRLGPLLRRLAGTRLRAFFAGLGVSVLAPSSTTMSVLALQAVRDGHLPPRRVLPLMLGADVGLTVMVLLVALRLDALAPGFVALGVLGFQFSGHPRLRGIGQVLLSLGFIFLGIGTISAAAHGVDPAGDLGRLLELGTGHPLLLAALAAVLAVTLQSSTATIGLGMGLAGGLAGGPGGVEALALSEPLRLAVPMVIGANVGTGVTLLLLGGRETRSRRLAAGNLVFKAGTAAAALLLLGPVIEGLAALPIGLDKRVAAAHTGFNLAMALVFLPLVGPVHRLVTWAVPDEPAGAAPVFKPEFIHNRHIDGATLATGQSRQEIVRVSGIVRSMLDDLWTALLKRDPRLAQSVRDRDDQVDLLDREVKRYLAQVAGADADEETAREVLHQLGYLNELETVGDVIDNNLTVLVVKRAEHDLWFSDAGWAELDGFYRQVAENLLIAETAFAAGDPLLARRLIRHKQALNARERELRVSHFQRLRAGQRQSFESSAVHLDILTHLKRINSGVTHVAYGVLEAAG